MPMRPTVLAVLLAALVAVLLAVPHAYAGPAPDKSGDHLFNPTPREHRRPLSADRPDATESPYTVDAGAVQLEFSLVEIGIENENGRTDTAISLIPFNLKLGLTDRIDLAFLFNPIERVSADGQRSDADVGDLGVRAKINLWGNDKGRTAMALMPYAVFPAGDRDEVTLGLIVPFAAELADGWDFGAQVELVYSRNERSRYEGVFSHTAVLGRELFGDLSGYLEYIGEYDYDGTGRYLPFLSTGLAWLINPDTQLDLGVVVGLDNPRTEDARIIAGMTLRF